MEKRRRSGGTPMIQLNNVTTGYSRDRPLKSNFSYTFEDNKIYGILGESGCGKSTLLKIGRAHV